MKVFLSIIIAIFVVVLFFIGFSYLVPNSIGKVENVFYVKIDEALNYNKYQYTWNEQESKLLAVKTYKGKEVLKIVTSLSHEENSFLKSAYYEVNFLNVIQEDKISTDGSWWYIENHGNTMKIRNPDNNVEGRNLQELSKLIRFIERISELSAFESQ